MSGCSLSKTLKGKTAEVLPCVKKKDETVVRDLKALKVTIFLLLIWKLLTEKKSWNLY